MQPAFLSGQLLLSLPGIGDPRFERVVIAMCTHDRDGALGLVVNHVIPDLTVPDLMRQLDIDPGATPARPVLAGGPVEPGRGFVLHDPDYGGGSTIQVGRQWALTATVDVLRAIAAGNGPRRWHAVLGYTGWGAGQLDEEMTSHGWLNVPGDPAIVFDTALEARWPAALAGMGIAPDRLAGEAGRA